MKTATGPSELPYSFRNRAYHFRLHLVGHLAHLWNAASLP